MRQSSEPSLSPPQSRVHVAQVKVSSNSEARWLQMTRARFLVSWSSLGTVIDKGSIKTLTRTPRLQRRSPRSERYVQATQSIPFLDRSSVIRPVSICVYASADTGVLSATRVPAWHSAPTTLPQLLLTLVHPRHRDCALPAEPSSGPSGRWGRGWSYL